MLYTGRPGIAPGLHDQRFKSSPAWNYFTPMRTVRPRPSSKSIPVECWWLENEISKKVVWVRVSTPLYDALNCIINRHNACENKYEPHWRAYCTSSSCHIYDYIYKQLNVRSNMKQDALLLMLHISLLNTKAKSENDGLGIKTNTFKSLGQTRRGTTGLTWFLLPLSVAPPPHPEERDCSSYISLQ